MRDTDTTRVRATRAAFLATIGGMTDGQFKAVFIIVVILAFMAGALLAMVWR
jgi:hypothetical protein